MRMQQQAAICGYSCHALEAPLGATDGSVQPDHCFVTAGVHSSPGNVLEGAELRVRPPNGQLTTALRQQ